MIKISRPLRSPGTGRLLPRFGWQNPTGEQNFNSMVLVKPEDSSRD